MTSATDELRRLLDERGVKWRAYTDLTRGSMDPYHSTYFNMPNGEKARVVSTIDRDIVVITFRATPEQAIAATLGTGTCHMRLAYEEEDADGCIWPDHYECDSCGAKVNGIMPYCDTEIQPKFCPNCGRKVVDDG